MHDRRATTSTGESRPDSYSMKQNKPNSIPSEIYDGLLDATLRALVKHGYSNLTVRNIDEEWDRSRQLINYYFDGKDDLLSNILVDLLQHAAGTLELSEADGPSEQLRQEIDLALLGPEEQHDEYWQFLTAIYEIQGQAHHHPEYQDILNQIGMEYVNDLAATIEDGIQDGNIKNVDARAIAFTLDDLITAAHFKKIYLGQDDAPRRTRQFIVEEIIERILQEE